jgi:MFS family permease
MSGDPNITSWQRERPEVSSYYEPLRNGVFRLFWAVAVLAITVVWMHDTGTAWFMRDLTNADPFMVSLIQAAASLPVMLLSLPMGTLGDLLDRRRFLLAAHLWMLIVLVLFWIVAARGLMTPWTLVLLTAFLGVGKAMLLPGLAAVIPELVSQRDLSLGVGLYSMVNNSARIVGPALAGALLVAIGIASVYALSVLLLFVSFALLLKWHRPARAVKRSAGYLAELHAGLIHCSHDRQFRLVVGRVLVFFLCAASVHALLPVLVDDPGLFGLAWGAYGVGALSGAVLFPHLSRNMSIHRQLSFGIFGHAIGLGLLALIASDLARLPLMLVMGMFWFQVMSTAQVGAQMALPESLRARGMGAFTMVVMAGVGLGAPLWGIIAKLYAPATAIFAAMLLSLLALTVTHIKMGSDALKG